MCGICGFVSETGYSIDSIGKMNESMRHRGPDDSGKLYLTTSNGYQVGLGQARLSIIDLSVGGHQPMVYKHLNIVFNGEIYNYQEIKNELLELGHQFSSNSDTEVILHSFEEWGQKCVDKFIGMFAFAIFDSVLNKLFCCRDRSGAKPFYYYLHNGEFIFGSELKVFHEHPEFRKELNMEAIEMYFRYGYIPSPYSIFNYTNKLEAGSWLIYDLRTQDIIVRKYWDQRLFLSRPKLNITYNDAKEELKSLIKSACNYRMVADVPVGVFLSGGYDSTLVTAITQESSSLPLNTYTIGFKDGNNEAPFAKATADYLGTEHTELYCSELEAQSIIKDLPFIFDEPFADSSAIPTILVSKLAVKDVKVALSADAGDEVFVGYNRYVSLKRNMEQVDRIPKFLRQATGKAIGVINSILYSNNASMKHRMNVVSNALQNEKAFEGINLLNGAIGMPEQYLNKLLVSKGSNAIIKWDEFMDILDPFDAALSFDYQLYLQNDILTKVDRAAMSVSLEGREPLLDHRIAEFAANLPLEYKYDGKTAKRILKDITHDYIPKEMMERPKTGFSIPITKWLKTSLSHLIDQEIRLDEIEKQGILSAEFIGDALDRFKRNESGYDLLVWEVLQFQMWYNRWMK